MSTIDQQFQYVSINSSLNLNKSHRSKELSLSSELEQPDYSNLVTERSSAGEIL